MMPFSMNGFAGASVWAKFAISLDAFLGQRGNALAALSETAVEALGGN